MQSVIGVKLNRAGKVYSFLAPPFFVRSGDKVIVETSNGHAFGVVSTAVHEIDERELEGELKPVIRIATEKDIARFERLKEKAQSQIPLIDEKVKALKLPMNLTGAEYSFDESKITISFTSEGRVDFRELLKLLASTLKCKIELRQIGIKDEVREKGGLGLCGRECCCTVFLKDAEHVSVKMAKLQNLSLNPTKTGGLCGRMMCCMAYEEPVYKELAKTMPEVGGVINTPDGTGIVAYNDLLNQRVSVKMAGKDGAFKIKEYTIDELNGKRRDEPIKDLLKSEPKEEPKPENKAINKSEKKPEKKADPKPQKNQEQQKDEKPAEKKNNKNWRRHKFFKNKKQGEKKNGIQN